MEKIFSDKYVDTFCKKIVVAFYFEEDIRKFLYFIDSFNFQLRYLGSEDKKWVDYIGTLRTKMVLLIYAITTDKMTNNKKDIIEVGRYLRMLGKELEEFDKNYNGKE